MDKVDAKSASRLILDLIRLGHDPTPQQYLGFLPRLQPFLTVSELDGAESPAQSNKLLALLWASMGDIHCKLGEHERAASAYSISTKFKPLSAVFYSYAKTILENDLSKHYEVAILALKDGEKYEREHTKAWNKFLGHLYLIVYHPRGYLDYLRQKKRRCEMLKQLELRIRIASEPDANQ